MKKIIAFLLFACTALTTFADEGMWLPFLISKNYADMQKMGFKLSAQELYSINNASMKDAIVHFGGGCTAEIISAEGLVLTNHHCGYDAIAGLSTVEKNYLMNGYAAQNRAEELPCPGLTVRFFVSVEDVTNAVRKATKRAKGEAFDQKLDKWVKQQEEIYKAKGYEVDVKPFFGGNVYYLMVFERFTDIRLVATPSEHMGKFGGDTDNWMWPRHTCDFSMFRIYSNNDNKPAAYSINNRPYQAKYHLPVSLKGVKEGDYSMVYGYPGRTQRYLTSYGVDVAVKESNPAIVKIRTKRLGIMQESMNKDQAIKLKYASNYASTANYWKYYIGQTEQLLAQKVLETKQTQEVAYNNWAAGSKYAGALEMYKNAYDTVRPLMKHSVYYREAFMTPALVKLAAGFYTIAEFYKKNETPEKIKEAITKLKASQKGILKNMDLATDKRLLAELHNMYYQDIPKEQHPAAFSSMVFTEANSSRDWSSTWNKFADDLYSKTELLNPEKWNEICSNLTADNLSNDVAVKYVLDVMNNYKNKYEPTINAFATKRAEIDKLYIGGLLEKNNGTLMYPDANSTQRITYGQVKAYQPKDAISYNFYTTAEGLLAKYKAGDAEFDLEPRALELLQRKDYGDYADATAGTLITCFITNNDITGGNSGSPVINGDGELIGTAFDGNWEAMSGDISFDKKYKRTIVADIRYVMWTLDKVLGGKRVIEEITIRR